MLVHQRVFRKAVAERLSVRRLMSLIEVRTNSQGLESPKTRTSRQDLYHTSLQHKRGCQLQIRPSIISFENGPLDHSFQFMKLRFGCQTAVLVAVLFWLPLNVFFSLSDSHVLSVGVIVFVGVGCCPMPIFSLGGKVPLEKLSSVMLKPTAPTITKGVLKVCHSRTSWFHEEIIVIEW